jgi:hypothetical protein
VLDFKWQDGMAQCGGLASVGGKTSLSIRQAMYGLLRSKIVLQTSSSWKDTSLSLFSMDVDVSCCLEDASSLLPDDISISIKVFVQR